MTKMNLVNKLYQETVIKKIKGTNWQDGTDAPFVVELDPTTVCDLACPGCISGDLLNQKNPEDRGFSVSKLNSLAEEFIEMGVKAVILIGGGEPLAHPSTIKIIEKLGKNKIKIGLTTNGTLMNRYLDTIAKYVSWTRVSMDAGSDEMFLKLRPTKNNKSKFNQVIENMKYLAKIKKGKLGYSFLIRTKADGMIENPAGKEIGLVEVSNINEISIAAKLAKDIGCDYFELKPSYDDDHQLVLHSEEDMKAAKDELLKAKTLENSNFKILESVMLESSLNREKIGYQKKEYTRCLSAEMRTLVTPSGCYVCPYFRGSEEKKIGDVRFSSFKEMWKETRTPVIKKLNPSLDCKNLHCIRDKTNRELEKLINHKRNDIDDLISDDYDLFI
jgi:MoaA/NifB/PqqE/SkfB family radical SAM enzyme